MSGQSFAVILARLEKVRAAAEANGLDLPLMEALHRELGIQMETVKALRYRRSALRAELKTSTRELGAFEWRAKSLASRIQALARACIVDRGTLSEFGIKPRRRARLRPERKEDEAPRNPTTL